MGLTKSVFFYFHPTFNYLSFERYADNVLKVFATSFSIVVSCIISALFFDFHATMAFVVGASLVVMATVIYSQPEKKPKRRKPVLPMTGSK